MSNQQVSERIEKLMKEFNSLPCTKEGLQKALFIGKAIERLTGK